MPAPFPTAQEYGQCLVVDRKLDEASCEIPLDRRTLRTGLAVLCKSKKRTNLSTKDKRPIWLFGLT